MDPYPSVRQRLTVPVSPTQSSGDSNLTSNASLFALRLPGPMTNETRCPASQTPSPSKLTFSRWKNTPHEMSGASSHVRKPKARAASKLIMKPNCLSKVSPISKSGRHREVDVAPSPQRGTYEEHAAG